MKKKTCISFLCICMITALLPGTAFAAHRGSKEIKVGETITLTSKGSWPYTWSAEDDSLVDLEMQGTKGSYSHGHSCAVTGLRPGTTTIRVDYVELVYDPNARADWFGDYGENVSESRSDTWDITVVGSDSSSGQNNSSDNSSNRTNNSSRSNSSAQSIRLTGSWRRDGNRWWFEFSDGSYPRGRWQMIDDEWYCFDDAGYMMTGWIWSGSDWYYCDTSNTSDQGKLLRDTVTPDGCWVDADGAWLQ